MVYIIYCNIYNLQYATIYHESVRGVRLAPAVPVRRSKMKRESV